MVDTQDLKSCGHNGCAGSSPAPGTENRARVRVRARQLELELSICFRRSRTHTHTDILPCDSEHSRQTDNPEIRLKQLRQNPPMMYTHVMGFFSNLQILLSIARYLENPGHKYPVRRPIRRTSLQQMSAELHFPANINSTVDFDNYVH